MDNTEADVDDIREMVSRLQMGECIRNEIDEWLNVASEVQGHEHLDGEGIVSAVLNNEDEGEVSEDDEDKEIEATVDHATAITALDTVILWY